MRFGTSHVLVVYDFPPSTRTTELEKIFEDFRDRGVAIRWVNDTVALAVFRTPSVGEFTYLGSLLRLSKKSFIFRSMQFLMPGSEFDTNFKF